MSWIIISIFVRIASSQHDASWPRSLRRFKLIQVGSLQALSWPWTVFPTLDPRLQGYPFVGNFWFMTGLVIAYLYFVKVGSFSSITAPNRRESHSMRAPSTSILPLGQTHRRTYRNITGSGPEVDGKKTSFRDYANNQGLQLRKYFHQLILHCSIFTVS